MPSFFSKMQEASLAKAPFARGPGLLPQLASRRDIAAAYQQRRGYQVERSTCGCRIVVSGCSQAGLRVLHLRTAWQPPFLLMYGMWVHVAAPNRMMEGQRAVIIKYQ